MPKMHILKNEILYFELFTIIQSLVSTMDTIVVKERMHPHMV